MPVPRVDAAGKAAGVARYLADLPAAGALHALSVRSAVPRGRIRSVSYPDVPPGFAFIDARDIPAGGSNAVLMVKDDWPVFADREVRFVGQTIALVVGPDRARLAELAARVRVDCDPREPAYTIDQSLELVGGPLAGADNLFADYTVTKGDPDSAFRDAHLRFEEEYATGWQEHVYLEPQGCLAVPEGDRITIHASLQCPFYIRKSVAHCLGWPVDRVRVVQPAVGGGFGGKEHYPDILATAAAVAALKLGRPVRLVLSRGEDLRYTSKRHPSRTRIRSAVDACGRVQALDVDLRLNAGAYETCSAVVLQRAVFHAAGVYDVPNLRVRGRACATDTVPSDAFRGFGAPQAIFAIEMHMCHLAARVGQDPVDFRRRHFLARGGRTVTGGMIREEVVLERMLDRVLEGSGYREKRRAKEPGRGIGVSFFLHGCGFTGSGERDIIRATVRLRGRTDGRVEILAAGVEMGQGLATTLPLVAARALGIPLEHVIYAPVDTDCVPDSGPTIASRSIMVVGLLVQRAARRLAACWKPGQEREVSEDYRHAPELSWDQERLEGDAYPTYGWGVNAVEARVDPATGQVEILGAWAAYDVGVAIDPLIVEGSAHGGMMQALGLGSMEHLELADGAFRQVTLSDYAIATALDTPPIHVELVDNPSPYGPSGAKGAGEIVADGGAPALAMAVEQAIGREVRVVPLTPERVVAQSDDAGTSVPW